MHTEMLYNIITDNMLAYYRKFLKEDVVMKKTLALVLALCMLIACVPAMAETEPTYTYNTWSYNTWSNTW